MQQLLTSAKIAVQNIRSNPLHTFLSTLGIIIGVAALVAILALGDGLEKTGREQMENTTSVRNMNITARSHQTINRVRIPLDTVALITEADVLSLADEIKDLAHVGITYSETVKAVIGDSVQGVYLRGTNSAGKNFMKKVTTGRFINEEEFKKGELKAVVTTRVLSAAGMSEAEAIGAYIRIGSSDLEIVGVADEEVMPATVVVPYSVLTKLGLKPNASIPILAREIEYVAEIKEKTEVWLDETFEGGKEAFIISTYEGRAEQFSQGVRLFKLVMGLITGISVLVGGIGIMNVLLISVTERTTEIGIRKASGAKKRDIVLQFISESVTVSIVGCTIGWLLGTGVVFGAVPIINNIVDIGFQAAISAQSVLIVIFVALMVGVVFGTYPAYRAANLTPVDAIRHE